MSKLTIMACLSLGITLGIIFLFVLMTIEGVSNYANPWALSIAFALWASAILLDIKTVYVTGSITNEHVKSWMISIAAAFLIFGIYQTFPSSLFQNDDMLKLLNTLMPTLANVMLVIASFFPLVLSLCETYERNSDRQS
ncbi:hypothetical protein OCF84_21470 (plasmid) [Shewanella xiamenensis]|nr:hypothetical protein [Shewanella xiamenensis]WHF57829.1 hypothetical protein OCF84_21470 [Shewanella xiamenensis]